MRTIKLAGIGTGIAAAAVLALSGCYSPAPEPQVVTVTPSVVAVTPPASGGMASNAPTFRTQIDLSPLQGHDMRLQSFAGDVCVADNAGNGFVSHCICAGRDCTCQGSGPRCTP